MFGHVLGKQQQKVDNREVKEFISSKHQVSKVIGTRATFNRRMKKNTLSNTEYKKIVLVGRSRIQWTGWEVKFGEWSQESYEVRCSPEYTALGFR